MEFYLGLTQIIGVHTILGLSAYVILQTGQVTMAQAGLVSVGAYVAALWPSANLCVFFGSTSHSRSIRVVS